MQGDENILNAAVLDLVEHAHPELGPPYFRPLLAPLVFGCAAVASCRPFKSPLMIPRPHAGSIASFLNSKLLLKSLQTRVKHIRGNIVKRRMDVHSIIICLQNASGFLQRFFPSPDPVQAKVNAFTLPFAFILQ
jgi:hypothetical protein